MLAAALAWFVDTWACIFYGHVHRVKDRPKVLASATWRARAYRASPWGYSICGAQILALAPLLAARDPGFHWRSIGALLMVQGFLSASSARRRSKFGPSPTPRGAARVV
mmetsp:Transcript_19794/g.62038  ORF Transcript_19794/g.62038 Transcript_19794/m.62038 type:complete len:109 (-) Transcript_19794:65-391(-)